MSNLTDVMIDLETLDVLPTATVLTIGAVRFDPYNDEIKNPTCKTLYIKVDMDSCDKHGLTVSDSTIEWWGKQSAEAQYEAFEAGDRVSLEDAMLQLHRFCQGATHIWSHGAAFDIVICENLFRAVGRGCPWKYYQARCTRTLYDLGVEPELPEVTAHDALADALNQTVALQGIFKKLGIKRLPPR